ncbi:MAG: hypothetical protein A2X49_07165 [Lentisphaerae bacterium GWF2_52_8]|nr:MAG: hypothetical protein A2X49_07165 [Lentisphaerae bacterium GWF2_52_8]
MKKELTPRTYLYPMPTVIVACRVGTKPNFSTVSYCGVIQHAPPMLTITMGKTHYSNEGIKQHGCFSVNIPSEQMLGVVDYIGLNSGAQVDKSRIFKCFYSKLSDAPLIEDCPVNLGCKLVGTLDYGGLNDIFVGEIVFAYAEESCMSNGFPDISKIKPIVFSMHDNKYWKIGEELAQAWEVGKSYQPPSLPPPLRPVPAKTENGRSANNSPAEKLAKANGKSAH